MRLSMTGVWRDNKNFVNSVAQTARWLPVTAHDRPGNQPITLYRLGEPGRVEHRLPDPQRRGLPVPRYQTAT